MLFCLETKVKLELQDLLDQLANQVLLGKVCLDLLDPKGHGEILDLTVSINVQCLFFS